MELGGPTAGKCFQALTATTILSVCETLTPTLFNWAIQKDIHPGPSFSFGLTETQDTMASLDVEALLDATAKSVEDQSANKSPVDNDRRDRDSDRERGRDSSRDRERDRDRDRDRDSDRRRRERSHRDTPDEGTPRSDNGSYKSRRRSRSRDDDRRPSRRSRDGDYYRSGRGRSRSRSPYRSRRDDRDRRDRRDRHDYGRGRDDDRSDSRRGEQLTEEERDRRTVFVQQLAARLRTRELKAFFEKAGPVTEAQIVKDRNSQRSKG